MTQSEETTPMRSILRRLARRHTTAVAYLALFAALGGSAYAAGTITGKNIKDGTITGTDVKNRSLGADKLSPAALSSLASEHGSAGPQGPKGATGSTGPSGAPGPAGRQGPTGQVGPTGPPGPTGPAGPAGPAGQNGISGWQYVVSDGQQVPHGSDRGVRADCPAGKKALGGGASSTDSFWARIAQSAPTDPGTGWVAIVANEASDNSVNVTAYAWVICANVAS
jgi:hypothetical protein